VHLQGPYQHGGSVGFTVVAPHDPPHLSDMAQSVLVLLPPCQVGQPQEQVPCPPLSKLLDKQVPARSAGSDASGLALSLSRLPKFMTALSNLRTVWALLKLPACQKQLDVAALCY
jgi:hypothetical protein